MGNTQRVAVVTGAGRGIGRCVALTFAENDILPVVVDINGSAADAVADEIRKAGGNAAARQLDISSPSDISDRFGEIADTYGSIDILVNNAGVLSTSSIADITEAEWNRVMDINIKGAAFATQAALEFMVPARWGRIINVSSTAGRMGGLTAGVAYSVSKAGIIGLTYGVARGVAPYGVTVNAVAPGPANTEMVKEFTQDERSALVKGIPVGKLIEPERIAETIAFLASDAAEFITGAVLDVNGGMFIG